MLHEIDHVNVVVADIATMIAFYRDVLGFAVTMEATISGGWLDTVVGMKDVLADVAFLQPPSGPRIEFIHYRNPQGARPPRLAFPNVEGIRHLAFRVSDIDAASSKLEAAGARVFGAPQTVPTPQVTFAGGTRKRLVYFLDPEDNLLELCGYEPIV